LSRFDNVLAVNSKPGLSKSQADRDVASGMAASDG